VCADGQRTVVAVARTEAVGEETARADGPSRRRRRRRRRRVPAVGVGVALAAAYLLGPVGGLTGSRALPALVLVTVALAAVALVGVRG
jgi:hypothetical protein